MGDVESTVTAGIYVRISDDREGAGLGVARQERDCRDLADRLGWLVVDVYVDNDLSAYSGRPRPQYVRMLDDVRAGRIRAIAAWHNDRLHRHPRELEEFISVIEQEGTLVHTVKAGEVDLSRPAGRMVARQLGAVARYESEHKADRIKAKHLELAKAGASTGGGHRPYGYRRIYDREEQPRRTVREELVPEEVEIIEECARRVLAGEPLASVCRDLNRRGVPTSGGGQWTARRVREAAGNPADEPGAECARRLEAGESLREISRDLNRRGIACPVDGQWSTTTLARLLASARIAGLREHRPRSRGETKRVVMGEITGKGNWPAIISEAQSQRLRALLSDPTRRLSPGATGVHLLTGVLHCGRCKQRLVGRSRGANKGRAYMCDGQPGRSGCGRMYIDADGTEAEVAAWAAEALSSEDLRHKLNERQGPDEDSLTAEIAADDQLLRDLAADLGEKRISRGEWLAARGPVERRIEVARRQLGKADAALALDGVPADREGIEEWLLDRGREASRRRAVVLLALERVMVLPAVRGRHRFDPDRLDPVWRA